MQADLDRLMDERSLDALVVIINDRPGANHLYLTRGAELTGGFVVKRRGRPALLYYHPMEAGGAAQSGLDGRSLSRFNLREIVKMAGDDRLRSSVQTLDLVLGDAEVSGRVAFYGEGDIGRSYTFLSAFAAARPDLEIVGEFHRDLLTVARETKDEREIEMLRDVGQRTAQVVAATVAFLQAQQLHDDLLVDRAGHPVTVGAVKRFIRRELLDRGLQDEGTIFAIGRDSAIPHNSGEPGDLLRAGQAIVFDIFPRDLRTGYCADMTRTFALAEAPSTLHRMYKDVRDAYGAAIKAMRPGRRCADLQKLVCYLFETRGYPTPRTHPTTEVGYVHGLGHGIGLEVHEAPILSDLSSEILRPGAVVTIEPGLYDPDAALGVRIEDTVALAPDGEVHILTDYPRELVIPLRDGM